jgi:hypothetical protein
LTRFFIFHKKRRNIPVPTNIHAPFMIFQKADILSTRKKLFFELVFSACCPRFSVRCAYWTGQSGDTLKRGQHTQRLPRHLPHPALIILPIAAGANYALTSPHRKIALMKA